MSILGRSRKVVQQDSKVSAGYHEGKFAATLKSMGYSDIPVLLTAADVRTLLGRIPNSLENFTACGEQGFYRAKDVERLWWRL